jgi:serine acetyltransferase
MIELVGNLIFSTVGIGVGVTVGFSITGVFVGGAGLNVSVLAGVFFGMIDTESAGRHPIRSNNVKDTKIFEV